MASPGNPIHVDGQTNPATLPSDEWRAHQAASRRRKQQNRVNPETFVDQVIESIKDKAKPFDFRLHSKWRESRLFMRGDQYLVPGNRRTTWARYQDVNQNLSYTQQVKMLITNKIWPAVRAQLKELVASNPSFQANPATDKPEQQNAAKIAQVLIDLDSEINEEAAIREHEALLQIVCGNWLKYTYPDSSEESYQEYPITEKYLEDGKHGYECPECGKSGDASELGGAQTQDLAGAQVYNAKCPNGNCQSQMLGAISSPPIEKTRQIGVNRVREVKPRRELIDPLCVTVENSARYYVHNSPYLLYRRQSTRAVVESEFPWADIPSTIPSEGMRTQKRLNRSAGANSLPYAYSDYTNGGCLEDLEVETLWLDPSMYQFVELDRDYTFGDPDNPTQFRMMGQDGNPVVLDHIPAGTQLGKLFDKGLRVDRVGKRILDIRNECKNDRWTHCGYMVNIDGFWCDDPVSQAVQIQKRMNALRTLQMTNAMTNSITKLVVDRRFIDPAKVSNNYETIVLEEQSPGVENLEGKAFATIPASPLINEVRELEEQDDSDLQDITGSQPTLTTGQDPKIKTATEAAIARDMQLGLIAPPAALRADAEVMGLKQYLKMWQQCYIPGQLDQHIRGKYSDMEMEAFLNCDVDKDLRITYAPGTHVPRTKMDARIDLMDALSFGGLPLGVLNPLLAQMPDVRRKLLEMFNNPLDLDDVEPDRRRAQKRLTFMLSLVDKLQKGGFDITQASPPKFLPVEDVSQLMPNGQAPINPAFVKYQKALQMVVMSVPYQPEVDNEPIYVAYYKEWLKTDDGTNAPAFTEACAVGLIQRHTQSIQQQAQAAQDQADAHAAKMGALEALPDILKTSIQGEDKISADEANNSHQSGQNAADRAQEQVLQAQEQQHEQQLAQMAQSSDSGGQ